MAKSSPSREGYKASDEDPCRILRHSSSQAYRVARRPDGALAGFLGVWDQSGFKRLRGHRVLPAARRRPGGVKRRGPLAGGTKLPAPGGALRNLTAVHVCVPPDKPAVLRSLVLDAYDAHRGSGYSLLKVGLDVRDPLAAGLKGLLAQPTDI